MTGPTSTWTAQQADAIGAADELLLAVSRGDGTLRPEVMIWVVEVGESLHIRSANGTAAAWYRHAAATHRGRIHAGGVESDVAFVEVDPTEGLTDTIQAAYRRKYKRYGEAVMAGALSPEAQHATWRLLPA